MKQDDLVDENARLRAALLSIAQGSANGIALFHHRMGERSRPTWWAVNALQDYLATSASHAARTLGVTITPADWTHS